MYFTFFSCSLRPKCVSSPGSKIVTVTKANKVDHSVAQMYACNLPEANFFGRLGEEKQQVVEGYTSPINETVWERAL